jgi:hypothetical protein
MTTAPYRVGYFKWSRVCHAFGRHSIKFSVAGRRGLWFPNVRLFTIFLFFETNCYNHVFLSPFPLSLHIHSHLTKHRDIVASSAPYSRIHGSIFNRDTGKAFHDFPQTLQEDVCILPWKMSRPFPHTSQPITIIIRTLIFSIDAK